MTESLKLINIEHVFANVLRWLSKRSENAQWAG